jgi:hypothetical protein
MTKWNTFVRSYAKKYNICYGCAMSSEEAQLSYKTGIEVPYKTRDDIMRECREARVDPRFESTRESAPLSTLANYLSPEQRELNKLERQLRFLGQPAREVVDEPVRETAPVSKLSNRLSREEREYNMNMRKKRVAEAKEAEKLGVEPVELVAPAPVDLRPRIVKTYIELRDAIKDKVPYRYG